jgi:hypothetical protein
MALTPSPLSLWSTRGAVLGAALLLCAPLAFLAI